MRDTHLTIDLDYFVSPEEAVNYFKLALTKTKEHKLPFIVVDEHHGILPFIPKTTRKICNLDQHSDIVSDILLISSCLNEGTWANFVDSMCRGTFVWIPPEGRAVYCTNSDGNDDKKPFSKPRSAGWKKVCKTIQLAYVWSEINSVTVSLSEGYSCKDVYAAIQRILRIELNLFPRNYHFEIDETSGNLRPHDILYWQL
jgi:hypothetical protein